MKRILVVAPHCDDETLGMGGTISRFAREGHEVIVAVMTGNGNGQHPFFPSEKKKMVREEAMNAMKELGNVEIIFEELSAALVGDLPGYQVNNTVRDIVAKIRPDTLFVPYRWDVQEDHRHLVHASNVAWRPHTDFGKGIREIYMYETVSETHWHIAGVEPPFDPNVWIDISEHLSTKLLALRCYQSQMHPFPYARSIEAVEYLARWRGSQVSCMAAEAFVLVRKLL